MTTLLHLLRDETVPQRYAKARPRNVVYSNAHSAWRAAHIRNALRFALSALRPDGHFPI
jgi:hypothetical protein